MELTPREKDKLLIFTSGLLAERRKARGLKLNYPEAIALISAAVERSACPNPLVGYTAPFAAAYPAKLIRCSRATVLVASSALDETGLTAPP